MSDWLILIAEAFSTYRLDIASDSEGFTPWPCWYGKQHGAIQTLVNMTDKNGDRAPALYFMREEDPQRAQWITLYSDSLESLYLEPWPVPTGHCGNCDGRAPTTDYLCPRCRVTEVTERKRHGLG